MMRQIGVLCIALGAVALAACGESGTIGAPNDPAVAADAGTTTGDLNPSPGRDDSGSPAPIAKPETCNGFDDDLDGKVDEDCGCSPGTSQPCYPGPVTELRGPCAMGQQRCNNGQGEFARWGACEGATLPGLEVCGDGVDQDCDGGDRACPPRCGDGQCNGSERCKDCPEDCGECASVCGDGQCTGSEDCVSCVADCAACPRQCDSFVFGTSARGSDILWVVDQSGSMAGNIARVKDELNAFTNFISASQVDYRVVMLAMRGVGEYAICIPQPLGGPSCGDGARYTQVDQRIDSDDALRQIRAHIANIEKPMRTTSIKHIVVVTDDNSTGISTSDFHKFIAARPGFHDYRLHGVIGLKPGGCVINVGDAYKTLAKQTGGLLLDMCQSNWSGLFKKLAEAVAELAQTHYPLTKPAKAGTVEVRYGGNAAQQGTDWEHDSVGNHVILKGTLPAVGQKIEVCYESLP